MIKKLLIFSFIILISNSLSAQQKENKSFLGFDGMEASYNNGIVLPHTEIIEFLTRDYVKSFSFNCLYNTEGKKLWQKIYNNPQLGFGFNYSTLGNKDIFGDAYSIYPFFEAPVVSFKDYLDINYRLSFGISYLTNTYHPYKNYENIAISSDLSVYFNFILNADIEITNSAHLFGAFGLTHFSNGKIKSPNLGINTVTTSMGVRYIFNDIQNEWKDFDPPSVDKKNKFSLIWSHGMKDHSRFISGKFYISSLNLGYERKYAHWAQYGIGVDAFYDESIKIKLKKNPKETYKVEEPYRFGAHISHDFLVDQFALTVQLGHYFYKQGLSLWDLYNRVGIKYYFNNHIIANLSLKSHNADARFVEFGIGFYLN